MKSLETNTFFITKINNLYFWILLSIVVFFKYIQSFDVFFYFNNYGANIQYYLPMSVAAAADWPRALLTDGFRDESG